MNDIVYCTNADLIKDDVLRVYFSDGTMILYNAVELGKEWFTMSNDAFFEKYNFDLNLPKYPELFEKVKKELRT